MADSILETHDIEVPLEALVPENDVARLDFYTEIADRLNSLTRGLSDITDKDEPTVNTSGSVLPKGTVYGFNSDNELKKARAGASRVQAIGVTQETTGPEATFIGANAGMHRLLLEPGINPQPYEFAYLSESTDGAVTNVAPGIDIQEIGVFKSTRANDGRAAVSVIMNMSAAVPEEDLYTGTTVLEIGDLCYFSADGVLSKADATVLLKPPQVIVIAVQGTSYQVAWPGKHFVKIAAGGTTPTLIAGKFILSDTQTGAAVIYEDGVSAGNYEYIVGQFTGGTSGGLYEMIFNPSTRESKRGDTGDF